MHVDLIVFSNTWNGDKYALHAYDAKGQGHVIETLASKDQPTLCRSIMFMIRKLRNEGRTIQFLHSDNENGFGCQFKFMLKNEGILFEPAVTYTPEQNGFAESSGNRICVVARSLRIFSGFPGDLWPELVRTAVYLLNSAPCEGLGWSTPFQKYKGYMPDLSNLKVVGCRAYVHVPREKRLAYIPFID